MKVLVIALVAGGVCAPATVVAQQNPKGKAVLCDYSVFDRGGFYDKEETKYLGKHLEAFSFHQAANRPYSTHLDDYLMTHDVSQYGFHGRHRDFRITDYRWRSADEIRWKQQGRNEYLNRETLVLRGRYEPRAQCELIAHDEIENVFNVFEKRIREKWKKKEEEEKRKTLEQEKRNKI